MNRSYSVGQVVFIVMNKKSQVYPMMVSEVITKKTLDGETTQYLLQAGSDPKSSIMMDEVDGEVFTSPELVIESLTKRFTSQVTKLVNSANMKAQEWYGTRGHQAKVSIDQIPQRVQPEDDSVVPVIMPDGTVANVKLPNASLLDDAI